MLRLGEKWAQMSDEERQPYVDEEKEAKAKYKEALTELKHNSSSKQGCLKVE